MDAKRDELKAIKVRIDEKRQELSRKKEDNERELAEISITSNAKVTAANEKEVELVAQIAKFLNVSVESIVDEGQGRSLLKGVVHLVSVFRCVDQQVSSGAGICRGR